MLADVGLLLTTEYPRPEEDDGHGIAGLLAGPRFERPGPAPRVRASMSVKRTRRTTQDPIRTWTSSSVSR